MRPVAVRYGRVRSQSADLWLPSSVSSRRDGVPVVVLIHGGFWRARFTKLLMNRLARSIALRGWAAWNIEYRRTGLFGGGGGWPATFDDVAAAVDHLALLDDFDLDLRRVVACGHSAGGHLATWLAARGRLPAGAPGTPIGTPVSAVVSLAGVVDLRRAAEDGVGGSAVSRLLGGSPAIVPDRYALASASELLPLGVPQVLVHGLDDDVVPPRVSAEYARQASAAGDDAIYVPVAGAGHRDMIMPTTSAWAAAEAHLERFCDD